jgi:hypothetical protein
MCRGNNALLHCKTQYCLFEAALIKAMLFCGAEGIHPQLTVF